MYLKLQLFAVFMLLGWGACSTPEKTLEGSHEVLAVVNSVEIHESDFRREMERLASFRNNRYFTPDEKKELLVHMVNFELLVQDAIKKELHKTNLQVKKTLAAQYLQQQINEKHPIKESDIISYYEEHKQVLDRIQIRHILIKTDNRPKDEAMRIIKEIKSKIEAGDSFAELAKQYSEDPGSNRKGGLLGYINRTVQFVPEFVEASFAIPEKGDLSPITETQFGYHIIRLDDDLRGLAHNRDEIYQRLLSKQLGGHFKELLVSLNNQASVDINFGKLENINIPTIDVDTLTLSEQTQGALIND